MFTKADYDRMHELVFRSDYSGYKPSVVEIPNGDGRADTEKKYAHIATKYFTTPEQWRDLMPYLVRAHEVACYAAGRMNVPKDFMPRLEYGALRVLDYPPPGAGSNRHEDFDLFTLMCYRDQPDLFVAEPTWLDHLDGRVYDKLRAVNRQAHMGQLGAEIHLGPATPHEVLPSDTRQCSIVYFAIPDHNAVLPSGVTVRDWLNARMARSRTVFKAYE